LSKKVLILSSGNSCRSILVEAIVNKYIPNVHALSAGIKANGKINPNVKTLLIEDDSWSDEYHCKTLDKVIDNSFDLVIRVCDKVNDKMLPLTDEIKTLHISYENHDKKNSSALKKLLKQIKMEIIPILRIELAQS